MYTHPELLTAFEETFRLIWQPFMHDDSEQKDCITSADTFYLAVPEVGRFLAQPKLGCILIDPIHKSIPLEVINTWLMGTVLAYMLQYHDYLVLHGSAVLMHDHAIVFSGASGAGKSTLAHACTQQGFPLITDDLVVVKFQHGKPYILAGPRQNKLWQDTMRHFNYDEAQATRVMNKMNKYVVPTSNSASLLAHAFPIRSFFEIHPSSKCNEIKELTGAAALQTLMLNAYRYFMLKPLNKVQTFFEQCSTLTQHINVHQLYRTNQLANINELVSFIADYTPVETT